MLGAHSRIGAMTDPRIDHARKRVASELAAARQQQAILPVAAAPVQPPGGSVYPGLPVPLQIQLQSGIGVDASRQPPFAPAGRAARPFAAPPQLGPSSASVGPAAMPLTLNEWVMGAASRPPMPATSVGFWTIFAY